MNKDIEINLTTCTQINSSIVKVSTNDVYFKPRTSHAGPILEEKF